MWELCGERGWGSITSPVMCGAQGTFSCSISGRAFSTRSLEVMARRIFSTWGGRDVLQ